MSEKTTFESTNDAPDVEVEIAEDHLHHKGLMDQLDKWESENDGRE